MDDKELVDAWRKEHKALLLATNNWCIANFQEVDGAYYDWHLQASWEGFLMAKRSQQIVVLPEPLICYNKNGQVDEVYTIQQLTAAGIKYTIGN